jgi:DNA-binding Lrp family transcriptional regulator
MPYKAYVLVNTNVGCEKSVFQQILLMPNVIHVYLVYGVYDLILRIEENDLTLLKEFIITKIRLLPEVRSTSTLMII